MSPQRKAALAFLCLALPPSQLGAQESENEPTLLRRELEISSGVEENLRFVDPGAEGWRTEVLHDAAKKGLRSYLDWAAFDEPLPVGTLREGFTTTLLRPARLETLFQDGSLTVLHAPGLPSGSYASETMDEAVGPLRSVFAGGSLRDDFFKILSVELGEERRFRTRFLYHAAIADDPFVTQVNLEGVATWHAGESDDVVSLEAIEVDHYEELSTPRPTFGDITGEVFAKTKRWRAEMLVGVDQLMNRNDRLIGMSYIGSQGIAIGDVDGDGLDDLYVAQQGGLANRLYRHLPDGSVEEISGESQVDFLDNIRGVLLIDVDNDGDQDLVTTIRASILISYNDGNGVFSRRKALRYNDLADIYSLAAADADGDGDLDLYACRYVTGGLVGGVPTPYHDAENGASNLYWRNEGNGEWREVSNLVGLDHNNSKFSLAACFEDFDGDGDVDLYVANDFGRNNLYINDGRGNFKDEAVERGADDIGAAMGVSVADVDLDGHMDILVTNMFSSAGRRIATQGDRFMGGQQKEVHKDYVRHARGNSLLRNRGDGTFEDITESTHMEIGGWAWGAHFIDINNDGYDDIYSPNGFLTNTGEEDL